MPAARGADLAGQLAAMAYLEAASVPAFRRLRRELVAHRAPRRLVRSAERAARDEVRHARTMAALARRYGAAAPPAPGKGERAVRRLESIALENVAEGCVRETFGALVAMWQSSSAGDPLIRAAMARIARDETRHAALAFQVDAWLRGRLSKEARGRVALARTTALRELKADVREAPAGTRQQLGLPALPEALRLIEQIAGLAA